LNVILILDNKQTSKLNDLGRWNYTNYKFSGWIGI